MCYVVRGGGPADRRALDDSVLAQTSKRVVRLHPCSKKVSSIYHRVPTRLTLVMCIRHTHTAMWSSKHRGSMKHANQTIKKNANTGPTLPCAVRVESPQRRLGVDIGPTERGRRPHEVPTSTRRGHPSGGMLRWLGRYDACEGTTSSADACSEMKRPDRSRLPHARRGVPFLKKNENVPGPRLHRGMEGSPEDAPWGAPRRRNASSGSRRGVDLLLPPAGPPGNTPRSRSCSER